ncbi:hypothetical protein LSTR_LSTR006125 [Laodelphax striatellus]|uniref:Uncharacterized protein n=1 Tax=Laodelphax striatellus TaxID=195883 RepID=A0A482WZQ4_LAOST|nr:hypothetical protein LSTR_LSTR006125 [Laodelphax striatellus]
MKSRERKWIKKEKCEKDEVKDTIEEKKKEEQEKEEMSERREIKKTVTRTGVQRRRTGTFEHLKFAQKTMSPLPPLRPYPVTSPAVIDRGPNPLQRALLAVQNNSAPNGGW